MSDRAVAVDPVAALERQLLVDRFEVITDPIGWRCLACGAEVRSPDGSEPTAINRLAESAADHAIHCGRCDD
ncbi:MAG: hypothetical protein AAF531_02685 [Actinomycetota bacterium]